MHRILAVLLSLLLVSPKGGATPDCNADPPPDPQYPAAIAEVSIPGGGARMPGLIYVAAGKAPHPTVVLLHGFPGNEKNLDIAQAIRRAGFNAVFFNYRGAWGAEGAYSVRQLDDDVAAVLQFLRAPKQAQQYRIDHDHLSLLGHSLGGFAALAAGAGDGGVVCVGAISPANPAAWKADFAAGGDNADRLLAYADSLFMLADFDGAELRRQLQAAGTGELDTRGFGPGLAGKSVLLVAGAEDTVTVPAVTFDPVVEAYTEVPGLRLAHHTLPGDHSFSSSRVRLTRLVLDWLERDCR